MCVSGWRRGQGIVHTRALIWAVRKQLQMLTFEKKKFPSTLSFCLITNRGTMQTAFRTPSCLVRSRTYGFFWNTFEPCNNDFRCRSRPCQRHVQAMWTKHKRCLAKGQRLKQIPFKYSKNNPFNSIFSSWDWAKNIIVAHPSCSENLSAEEADLQFHPNSKDGKNIFFPLNMRKGGIFRAVRVVFFLSFEGPDILMGSTSHHEVMEMRHSGVHPLLWDQDHPLCSGLCSTISAELKRNSIYWMESSLKEHEALFSWRWSLFQNTWHAKKKVTFVSAPAVFLNVWFQATSSNQHDFVRLRHPSPMYPSTKGGAPPSARASLRASLLGVRHLTWCDSLTQNVARELHISFVTF